MSLACRVPVSSVHCRLATHLRLGFPMLWMLWMWLLSSCCHCFHCLSLSRCHTIVNLDECWLFVSWSDCIVSSHQSRGLSFGSRPENIEARAMGRWSLTRRPVMASSWATLGSAWLDFRAQARALTSLGACVGIVAGNPQVTQLGLHPYPHLPIPATCTGLPVETSPKTAKMVEKWLRYEQDNVLWRFYSYLSHFSTVSAVFGLVLNMAGWKIHTHTRTRAYPCAWPVQVQ